MRAGEPKTLVPIARLVRGWWKGGYKCLTELEVVTLSGHHVHRRGHDTTVSEHVVNEPELYAR